MASPSKNAFPSVFQAALLLLAGYLFQYLVAVALYDMREVLGLTSMQVTTLAMLLSYGVIVAAVTHHLGISYRDLMQPGDSSPIATFVLLAPPTLMLLPLAIVLDIALITFLELIFPLSAWEQKAFANMMNSSLAAIIATCVLAPVFEEMLFRGILLRAFLLRYPRWLAISYSALFFGVAHLNIYQFFLAFFLGLLFGWLFERSQSLVPSMVLHAAINTTLVVLQSQDDAEAAADPLSISALGLTLAVVAATLGGLMLRRMLVLKRAPRHSDAID